jgi:hypothetical protein
METDRLRWIVVLADVFWVNNSNMPVPVMAIDVRWNRHVS